MGGTAPKAKGAPWGAALNWVAIAALGVALWFALGYAPDLTNLPAQAVDAIRAQHIFYFHVSAAWVGFLAFFVTFVGSIAVLRTGARKWDILAMSSAELGLLFTTMVVLTGPLWAKPTWGAFWDWSDPKLSTVAVLWLIYLAYVILRRMVEGEGRRARFSAVLGIIGFLDVPIVFGAARWWGQSVANLHPIVVGGGGFDIAPKMLHALLVSIFAFSLVYAALVRARVALERRRDEADELKQSLGQ